MVIGLGSPAPARRRRQLQLRRAALPQRVGEAAAQHLVDERLLEEPHLGLRRVHVDVDAVRRDLDEEVDLRAALLDRRDAVGVGDRVRDRPVRTMRRLTKTFCWPRTGPWSPSAATKPCTVRPPASLWISIRSDARRTAGRSARGRPAAGGHSSSRRPPLVSVKPTSGYPSAICVTSREICAASAWSDFRNFRRAGRLKNRSATSMLVPSGAPTSRTDDDRPGVDAHLGAGRAAARARAQQEARHRRDARQRLAAEPERPDRAEIVRLAILLVACRSIASRASSGSIPSPSSSTRISFLPPSSIATPIRARMRVERVLDQLLDDRGGPLDDLAGGDLVGEMHGQAVDAAASGSHRAHEVPEPGPARPRATETPSMKPRSTPYRKNTSIPTRSRHEARTQKNVVRPGRSAADRRSCRTGR